MALNASTSDAALQSNSLARFTYKEYHMGVDAQITVFAKTSEKAVDACAAAYKRIAELDTIMSDYRKDSELNQLCAKAGGPAVKVSPDLFKVLERANEVSKLSKGGFDVSVGPLVVLWRSARKMKVLPLPDEIESAKKLVGYRKIILNKANRTVKLLTPGMKLDLGGIAKGYANDEAQKVLKRYGITRAMVVMGGDILVTGAPPGTKGWKIRVPNASKDQTPADLFFANRAISTSGDTEQYVVIGGVQYSHVVDPRTGWARRDRVQTTVVTTDGLTSDPLSKAISMTDAAGKKALQKRFKLYSVYIKTLKGTQKDPS